VIKAASEVAAKGYARITLLGDAEAIAAEAKKLGADISACSIVDPKVCRVGGWVFVCWAPPGA
jgi:phosphotransacetylase